MLMNQDISSSDFVSIPFEMMNSMFRFLLPFLLWLDDELTIDAYSDSASDLLLEFWVISGT